MSDHTQIPSVGSPAQPLPPASQPLPPVVPSTSAPSTLNPQPTTYNSQPIASLGFATPISMSTNNTARLQSSVVPPVPTAATSISQVLEQRAPQSLQPQPIASTNTLEIPKVDPTKLAQVSINPIPPAIPTTPIAPATQPQLIESLSPDIILPPAPQTPLHNQPPTSYDLQPTTVPELSDTTKMIYKFLHIFLTLILVLQGVLGIYASMRFIIVDFPAFEHSFAENQLADSTITAFITKAGLMLLATAISLFFVVHMNIFHRNAVGAKTLLFTFAAVVIVTILTFAAMGTQL